MPVGEVETAHGLGLLKPVWKSKSETASRVRGRIETILDSAKARGHHRAMSYAEVPAFVRALRERKEVAALALEFAILTAVRSGEVIGATGGEVDLEAALWRGRKKSEAVLGGSESGRLGK